MMVIGLHERLSGRPSGSACWTGYSPGSTTMRTCGGPARTRSRSGSSTTRTLPRGSTATPPLSAAYRDGAHEARIRHLPPDSRLAGLSCPRPAAHTSRGKKTIWKALAWSTPQNSCAISLICEMALTAAPSPDRTRNASLPQPSHTARSPRLAATPGDQHRLAAQHRRGDRNRGTTTPRRRRGDLGSFVARAAGRRNQPDNHQRLLQRWSSPPASAGRHRRRLAAQCVRREAGGGTVADPACDGVGRPSQPGLPE
jgi:hypothetical protein